MGIQGKTYSYEYDAWGRPLGIYNANGVEIPQNAYHVGLLNPFRYRGYRYDADTGFYYLQSRYYDPAICRYINADCYTSTGQGFLGYNPFAYCANNPVNCVDSTGNFLDTIFDVVSIAFSIVDVVNNPTDPWAWAGLAGDLIDLIPFVSGVGEATKAVGAVADVVDVVDDVHDAAKIMDAADDLHDASKIVDNISDSSDAFKSYTKLDGGCTGGHCFVEGTLVLTDDGNQPIEDIRVGDYVWAADPETGELELKQVLNLFRNVTEELTHIYVQGEEIICTPGHDFYSPEDGWIDAEKLQTGDVLVLLDGDYVLVESTYTEMLELPVTIYNFEVEEFHTYFVGESGILVHNRGCLPEGNPLGSIQSDKRFTSEQSDLLEMANEYKRTGISRDDADALWELTEETGLSARTSCHKPQFDSYQGGKQYHLKINGMHINIFD